MKGCVNKLMKDIRTKLKSCNLKVINVSIILLINTFVNKLSEVSIIKLVKPSVVSGNTYEA